MGKKAILLGASGLIGNSLLQQLLLSSHYDEVLVVLRKTLNIQHPKLHQLQVDFDQLSQYSHEIQGDVVFCCLGTTKKKTPDKAQYKKIDHQYPIDAAWIAHTNGATQYHLVSALGANSNSSIFYSKLKGDVEKDLKTIPFKAIHIYRPSLLDGFRIENRTGERWMIGIMRIINPILIGPLRKYRSIKIETVARAMLMKSLEDQRGIFIHPSDAIERIVKAGP
ncbi:NAD(P)H-binding protein [Pedobacter immunditicola]|uniref:NAD(P)H-binding protein n=1 Tax=Pedobacter immunditicola TaxID=3133440 RepID=UPI0030A8D76A